MKTMSNSKSDKSIHEHRTTMFYGSSSIIFANAKKLRLEPTAAEIIFWNLLKQYFPEFRFKRQHPISDFIADFYCHKLKLVIEIDGSVHNSREAKSNDKVRDQFMESINLKILRFSNEDVCKHNEAVIKKLKIEIESIIINANP